MEFKSQICTSRSQSEKLLALGLKKETADMYYQKLNDRWELRIGQPITYGSLLGKYFYPAWSMHRLLEILSYTPELSDFAIELQYDAMIIHIANAIEANNINKDYLEEKL